MKAFIFIQFMIVSIFSNVYSQWTMTDSIESSVDHICNSNGKLFLCSATTGVYISSDSGYSFIPSNYGLDNLNTRYILPKDSLLILGTNNGIYKSMDQGVSWILSSNGFPMGDDANVNDMILKGDSILVSTYGSGIYCSTDECGSWFPLNDGFLDLYRSALILADNVLFAGTAYGGSGIYTSVDGGVTWRQKNHGVPFNPYNPDKYIDITSFTALGNSVYASTHGGNILLTGDHGDNWTQLECLNSYANIIINKDGNLYCAHANGVTISMDGGISWTFKNEGLITPFDLDIYTLSGFGSYIYAGSWFGKVFRRPIEELITSVDDCDKPMDVMVYPNPFSARARIILPDSFSDELILEVFNSAGQILQRNNNLNGDQLYLDKDDFGTGLFIFKISGREMGSAVGKFIIY